MHFMTIIIFDKTFMLKVIIVRKDVTTASFIPPKLNQFFYFFASEFFFR